MHDCFLLIASTIGAKYWWCPLPHTELGPFVTVCVIRVVLILFSYGKAQLIWTKKSRRLTIRKQVNMDTEKNHCLIYPETCIFSFTLLQYFKETNPSYLKISLQLLTPFVITQKRKNCTKDKLQMYMLVKNITDKHRWIDTLLKLHLRDTAGTFQAHEYSQEVLFKVWLINF